MTSLPSPSPSPFPVPVDGLRHLSNETRMIATPWSRMVRGIGLGQYPVAYDPAAAERIRRTFALLDAKGVTASGYTRFSRLMAEFVLGVLDPARPLRGSDLEEALGPVLEAVRAQENPYFRLMAGCIVMDSFAKLGLDRSPLLNADTDFPAEILAVADAIEPDRIKDENAGRHGQYEKLSAYSAVFLALGQLGLGERLVAGRRNYVREALGLLEQIPAPFFRGRGGAVLLSVISLLGYGHFISGEGRDHIKEVLDHLDRADELNSPPVFPQPMSEAFPQVYPLLTMLNAIAMTGRPEEYLTHGRDRLAQAKELMGRITSVERTHMGLYHVMALHNLGRLDEQVPDLDALVEEIVGEWVHIDPGANYFLNGIAYAYVIQTAMLTGRMDLIGDKALDRLVDGFPDLNRTDDDRVNRPYPFAYTLNVLGEIGRADLLFEPREAYGGASPMTWVIDQLSEGGREEPRLYMLDHALISYALRMRGPALKETPLSGRFRFPGAAVTTPVSGV
ncbi:hypothetical protein [Streptomyces sp. NBC_00503]|uniref:hypothetical protein n=1 Tax=Streptomyces sp. NBC_00503 TaxID=2903659 RepID=UPI002E81C0E6|nr:hypothetical protein [Streptomyces sp. NBC_00503]WUD86451.1 hypothetical protein OG490_38230 [Streptomyces sp. NBC_00503]